jgi:hypothetical protein
MNNQAKRMILAYKIFSIGLLLQFFLHTFVTFKLNLTGTVMNIIWSWKEIAIVGGWILALIIMRQQKIWKSKHIMWYITLTFLLLMGYTLIDTLLRGQGIIWFIKAWKYDLIGFMILILTYYLNIRLSHEEILWYVQWAIKLVKPLLIWALIWYCVLLLKPGVLKIFGYDRLSIEWEVGKRPPAVYRTREFEGFPRNQFIFERPISRGFFLTALFPLFFVQFLQRKSMKKTWFWWVIYALNVIVTYSRAAWGSWIIELAVLGCLTYRKQMKFFIRKLLIPALLVFIGIAWLAKDQVINRQFSNTGHVQLLTQGRHYFTENPLFGKWAWVVWPASHRVWWLNFNPENQFLQIAIEFGIIWFGLWMIIYMRLLLIGYRIVISQRKAKQWSTTDRYVVALSIGMLWLSISGLVLHSFTDRMIVYPYMVLAGCIISLVYPHVSLVKKSV